MHNTPYTDPSDLSLSHLVTYICMYAVSRVIPAELCLFPACVSISQASAKGRPPHRLLFLITNPPRLVSTP